MKKTEKTPMPWNGKRIRDLRQQFGETQEEFASRFRVCTGSLRHWEQDRGSPSGPVEVILDQLEEEIKEYVTQPA